MTRTKGLIVWLLVAAFAIATSGGLDDRIQWAKSTPSDGKIDVDTCLDKLGGDESVGNLMQWCVSVGGRCWCLL